MADNISIKDSAGVAKDVAFKDVSSVYFAQHVIYDSAGAELKGQKTSASSLPVVLPSNMQLLGMQVSSVSATITLPNPATAPGVYASGDIVANNATPGSVTPWTFSNAARITAGPGVVRSARMRKSTTSLTNAAFRLHLYTASPTVTNGDNGVFLTVGAGATPTWIGSIDFLQANFYAFSDGAACSGIPTVISGGLHFELASGKAIYGLLEARAAYTPGAGEVVVLTVNVDSA
jgi:hypothetical protein